MSLIIGVPCDRTLIGSHFSHSVGEKYIAAVCNAMDAVAILIPAMGSKDSLQTQLALVDGILLTGSYSNVFPSRYKATPVTKGNSAGVNLYDKARDSLVFPLIQQAYALGIPLLGLCRGCQEINVAFGGTLYQQVQVQLGMQDHRENKKLQLIEQYAYAHKVTLAEGGWLKTGWGHSEAPVNSLHQQGLATIGHGLRVEAVAPDGLVEAISSNDTSKFLLGVQWHPEWQVQSEPFYAHIFTSFAKACRSYHSKFKDIVNEI